MSFIYAANYFNRQNVAKITEDVFESQQCQAQCAKEDKKKFSRIRSNMRRE